MLLIALRKGGSPCSKDCPFYEDNGVVRGINGPLKTHCRGTMESVMVDCDIYNPMCIDKMEITEAQWNRIQSLIGKRAIRQRKLYPEDHENANQVGCEWTRSKGKWNAQKSASIHP